MTFATFQKHLDHFALPVLLALTFCGLAAWWFVVGADAWPLDDAYIIDHTISGVFSGHETRYPGATPWQGITSPLYVVMVMVLSLLLPVPLAHALVSALSILCLTIAFYALGRRHALSGAISAVLAITSLIAGLMLYQLVNGLETGMAMAALAWLLVAFDRSPPPPWAYVLTGIAVFIRPELAALSLLLCCYVVVQRPAGCWRGLLIALASFAVLALILWLATGSVLPNTISAKTYFFAEGCQSASVKGDMASLLTLLFVSNLGLFALGFLFAALSRLRLVAIGFIAVFLLAYWYRFPGALGHNGFRYLYLLLPIATLGWAAVLGSPYPALRNGSRIVGVLALLMALLSINHSIRYLQEELDLFAKESTATAKWVAANVPPDAKVMIQDAGRIAQYGTQPLIDMVGLKSLESIAINKNIAWRNCQPASAIADVAAATNPDYLVITNDWNSIFALTDRLQARGWTVTRVDAARGDTFYQVYKIQR